MRVSLHHQIKNKFSKMSFSEKILISGKALNVLGSNRLTYDTDYLVFAPDMPLFIADESNAIDYINAASKENGGEFFAKIWDMEKGNQIASINALAELKAFALVQHCLNGKFKKADEAEFDIKFLTRLGAKISVVYSFVSKGEANEIKKIVSSVKF